MKIPSELKVTGKSNEKQILSFIEKNLPTYILNVAYKQQQSSVDTFQQTMKEMALLRNRLLEYSVTNPKEYKTLRGEYSKVKNAKTQTPETLAYIQKISSLSPTQQQTQQTQQPQQTQQTQQTQLTQQELVTKRKQELAIKTKRAKVKYDAKKELIKYEVAANGIGERYSTEVKGVYSAELDLEKSKSEAQVELETAKVKVKTLPKQIGIAERKLHPKLKKYMTDSEIAEVKKKISDLEMDLEKNRVIISMNLGAMAKFAKWLSKKATRVSTTSLDATALDELNYMRG